ncbi:MAG: hypothetical protein NT062_04380 [Proteobacteria bacterium]|nr:hypothetical protein [Pseudomonadota bacterium]
MSRFLILCASHFGTTRAIADRIARRLRAFGHRVDVVDAQGEVQDARIYPPAADYDVVIVGSRVEFGRFATSVVDYLRDQRMALLGMPTGFFSVSMAAADLPQGLGCDPSGYNARLFTQLAWTPTEAAGFAGALPYRRYGHVRRWVMKQISKAAGHPTDTSRDHQFTDDVAVDAFADQLRVRVEPRSIGAATHPHTHT